LPRVVDAVVAGEGEDGLLAVDLHLLRRERGLEPVGDALVVGAEHDRVAALEVEPELGEALAETRPLLADRGPDPPVPPARPPRADLRRRPERRLVDAA